METVTATGKTKAKATTSTNREMTTIRAMDVMGFDRGTARS
jgi:hypothetical protein